MSLNSGCRERSLLFKGHFGILTWSDSGRCGWCVRVGVVVIAALCILLTSLCCSLLLVSRFRPLFLPLLSLHLISIYFPPYHIFFFSSSLCLSESRWLSSRYQQTDRQADTEGEAWSFFYESVSGAWIVVRPSEALAQRGETGSGELKRERWGQLERFP